MNFQRWTDLESQFNAGLLQEGETRAMAEKLIGARDAVLGCYYSWKFNKSISHNSVKHARKQ